jgi:hypothetical protein
MKVFWTILKVVIMILFAIELSAGPTIIRDNRVTDLSTTPNLGRGYSIGTNTFQSACMEKVVITEPSYDMKYSFEQVEDKGTETKSTAEQQSEDRSSSERKSASSSKTSVGFGFSGLMGGGGVGGNYSSTRSGIDRSLKSASKKSVINGKTWYSHSMAVNISVISYYASLDESRSKLSKSAMQLLINKDLPGFFSSCGPYYVRSIGRHATFFSIFSYQTETETRDESFEDQLRTEISKFSAESKSSFKAGGGLFGLIAGGASVSTNKSAQSQSSKDIEERQRKETFNRKAENYRLTINSSAYGLGIDKKATLIAFDMDSFKTAAKDAFMAMQNPRTGKVSSIEVVPWVENTEFQALVKIEEEEIPDPDAKNATGDTTEKPPKTKLLYEKKHILNQNAEFFMEIERADRNKLNMYYKAALCRKNLNTNFKEGNEIKGDYVNALLANHRGGALATIQFLDEQMNQKYVDALYQKEQEFMYGVKDDDEDLGASECIRQIMLNGIFKKSYREIEQCQTVTKEMGDIQSDLLENYCMPEISY